MKVSCSASQIVFLTMKLKDKLHPQRNRTRAKPPDLELSQNPSAILLDQERAVLSSLQYFKALVDRLDLDRPSGQKPGLDRSMVGGLLGGASTGILEAVQALVKLEPDELDSKTVSACLARLYGAVAQLIRWADRVMLQGVSQDDGGSSESVTTVIRGVLNSAKELVRLVAERRKGSTPLSLVQSQSGNVEDEETSMVMPPREGRGDRTEAKGEGTHAPPKPPMPVPEPFPQATPPQELVFSPPALPPKRRQTPPLPASAHCRVAIVTPIIRQPEEDLQVEDDSCCKRLSSSSADSAANSSPSEDDPDYDFLHTDLSSSQTLPPALPEKRHRSITGVSASCTFGFNSTHVDTSPAPSDDVIGPETHMSCPLSPKLLQDTQSENEDSSVDHQQGSEFSQRSREEDEEDELLLADPNEIRHRITLKSEVWPRPLCRCHKSHLCSNPAPLPSGGGGARAREQRYVCQPITRGHLSLWGGGLQVNRNQQNPPVRLTRPAAEDSCGSVRQNRTGPDEQNQYQEAFLCTYRGFATPSDVISKLQRRYP
ncbi:hypothetical protein CCH79_00020074 [Gambusia affinis]|uniref:N-terminal Ras-GEF domain-containing protein n=1 Tax=Gambusia affinis TaxID=33528 RepID=A0A315V1D1_GAMAF|nr:hypothetical protein CCH79_00020074 [Gambusia affinis]